MIYVIFIDQEQLDFLGDLSQGSNRILEDAIKRMSNERVNLYYAEFRGYDFFALILEVKRLDKSTALTKRFIELARLQDINFDTMLESFERNRIRIGL